jgi:hypothetical protein
MQAIENKKHQYIRGLTDMAGGGAGVPLVNQLYCLKTIGVNNMKIIHLILALSLAFSGTSFAVSDSDSDQVAEKQSKSWSQTFSTPIKIVTGVAVTALVVYVAYKYRQGRNPQPQLVNPQPQLVKSQPQLVNPQPQLVNPQPQLVVKSDEEAEAARIIVQQRLDNFLTLLAQRQQAVNNDPQDDAAIAALAQSTQREAFTRQMYAWNMQTIQDENNRYHQP